MPRPRPPFAFVFAALVLVTTAVCAGAAPRRVLLLYSYEREFSHFTFARLFRPELSRTSPDPIDFVEISLQSVRNSHTESEPEMLAGVRAMMGSSAPDLVVPLGGPAATFAQKYREQLFPATPILLAAFDNRFLKPGPLPANQTAVAVHNDPLLAIGDMLQVLPDTTTILVVVGASQVEQFWLEEMKRTFHPFQDRVSFVYSNRMSMADLLARAGSLPPHSAIFYGILSIDAAGVPQIEDETLAALHAAANAPMFGLHSHQLGRGIVGGRLLSMDDITRDTAAVALRLLRGEPPARIQPHTILASAPVYDARELHRWRIPEARLQAGHAILFREPSAWWRNPVVATGIVAFIGLQVLLAIALAVRLRRRPAPAAPASDPGDVSGAEAALTRLTRRLMQAQEEERARIASTLHDDVCQQLVGLKMRLHTLGIERNGADSELRARIEDLCGQFSALERQILSLSDPVYARLEILGLTAAARAFCERLGRDCRIALDFSSSGVPATLGPDVTIALFRVLQEAMNNAVTHAATPRIAVKFAGSGVAIDMDIADAGVGFDPQAALRRGAVGLLGMRERLRLVGGDCTFESRPGEGTRIRAHVPL